MVSFKTAYADKNLDAGIGGREKKLGVPLVIKVVTRTDSSVAGLQQVGTDHPPAGQISVIQQIYRG